MATPNQYAGELTGLATAPAAAKLEVQIVERIELSTKAKEPCKKPPLPNLENDQLFEIAKRVASQRKLDARGRRFDSENQMGAHRSIHS